MRWLRCYFRDQANSETIEIDVLFDDYDVPVRGYSYYGSWRDADGL